MQRGIVLHRVQNIVDVSSLFSALYTVPVQNYSIPDLASANRGDYFRLNFRTMSNSLSGSSLLVGDLNREMYSSIYVQFMAISKYRVVIDLLVAIVCSLSRKQYIDNV